MPFRDDERFRQALARVAEDDWQAALEDLNELDAVYADTADILELKAACEFRLGHYESALSSARAAFSLDNTRHEAGRLAAQSLRKSGRLLDGLKLLAQLNERFPGISAIRSDYGDFVCKVMGDWGFAHTLWQPLRDESSPALDWFDLKTRIYHGGVTPQALSTAIFEYAGEHLTPVAVKRPAGPAEPAAPPSGRKRIGLISNLFRASPVYYLCFGALAELADEYELVFFSRETVNDWATEAFRELAGAWHEVSGLSPARLADRLAASLLDVLVDLSGWLDQDVLIALGYRPAPRQYKWVGGQSTTTGLTCFDGFISDEHQSPADRDDLYSERLCRLPHGYVSYTPPAYLPAPQLPVAGEPSRVGVISHPMKLSQSFIDYLVQEALEADAAVCGKVSLQFIGWRYGLPVVQKRLLTAFRDAFPRVSDWFSIEFSPALNHTDFLTRVAQLDWVVDTFPYTAGLTALESLALGVPVRTRAGAHCSERHAYSHCRFAGLTPEQVDIDRLGPYAPSPLKKDGDTLLPAACPRRDHQALAVALGRLFDE